MKRTVCILCGTLFTLLALLPLGVTVSACFGCVFELLSYPLFAALTALLALCLTVLTLAEKVSLDSKAAAALFTLCAPLSLINAVFFLLKDRSLLVAVCLFASIICTFFLCARHGKPAALKLTSSALSALLILPVGFFALIALTFGNFAANTVISSVSSPEGTYRAELIDSDQGALGGDTIVRVYKNGIDAGLLRVTSKPQIIYRGEWGEAFSMEISWYGDDCLLINSKPYPDIHGHFE